MNGEGGEDPSDRLVPTSVIMAAGDNLYIEDFNLEPLQQMGTSQQQQQHAAQLVLPDMDALRLCRGGRGLSPHHQHQHHHHQQQLHALMPLNPNSGGGGMLQLHNQATATTTLQLTDMQVDPLRLGLTTAAYGGHHPHQQHQQQQQHHNSQHHHQQQTSMKYPGTPPDTPPGMSGESPSPSPYSGQLSLASPSSGGPTTINVDVSEIVWRSYQDQPIDLRGQCDLVGREDLADAKWLSSLEYSTSPSEVHCKKNPIYALPF
jgi:hypothetical protein